MGTVRAGWLSFVLVAASPCASAQTVRLLDCVDRHASRLTESAERDGQQRWSESAGGPIKSLVRTAALAPGSAAIVRARVHVLVARKQPARLTVTPLRTLPATPNVVDATERLDATHDPNAVIRVATGRADEWQQLEVSLEPCAGRQAIALELSDGDDFAVERLTLFEFPPSLRPWIASRLPDDRSGDAWRRVVQLGDDTLDALMLRAGDRVVWRLPLPAGGAKLHAEFALLPSLPRSSVAVSFTIDGKPAGVALPAPEERFAPWTFDLPRIADRDVELAFEAAPDLQGAVLIGAPMIVAAASTQRNLVVISIDTLRSDQLGCYGAKPSVTPAIDALAAAGTRFARFVAASSWTLPSHATLFSGQEPPMHGANRTGSRLDPARTPLLARELATAGFVTAAFTGGGFLDPAFGFACGFDHYSTRDPGRLPTDDAADAIDPMAPAIGWLANHSDESFFLFVHSYVVHDYAPDDRFLARIPADAASAVTARDSARVKVLYASGKVDQQPALQRLYRAALLQADELVVARVRRELSQRSLDGRTLVCLVSDHGDQWYEHEGMFHGGELWRELVAVPCILAGPSIEAGTVRDDTAGHLDIAPTLLARLGVARPAAMRGRDLLSADCQPAPVFSMVHGDDGIIADSVSSWPWRLIRRRSVEDATPELNLFRLDVDAGELHDLSSVEPERLATMKRWLDLRLEECARAAIGALPAGATIDSELRRRLDELGYGDR